MPKPCPECKTTMLPADEMDCETAQFVCPECAPDFVLCRATSYTDLEPEEFGYKTTDT